jgi:hypothetical protein
MDLREGMRNGRSCDQSLFHDRKTDHFLKTNPIVGGYGSYQDRALCR